YYGVGRRKSATAQVRLYPAPGGKAFIVNGRPAEEYFTRQTDLEEALKPLNMTGSEKAFRITALVKGGGISGQAGAIRHAIARALLEANPELKRPLRQAGFLTRDPRVKERKKPGLKRARKAPQYTKR
ncbi:MAG: 30S ribosomal protein S9, partial [Chloroflexi bacterium]|nr:30S ribosomal protein S9 [Chloroflexota bacterium]